MKGGISDGLVRRSLKHLWTHVEETVDDGGQVPGVQGEVSKGF